MKRTVDAGSTSVAVDAHNRPNIARGTPIDKGSTSMSWQNDQSAPIMSITVTDTESDDEVINLGWYHSRKGSRDNVVQQLECCELPDKRARQQFMNSLENKSKKVQHTKTYKARGRGKMRKCHFSKRKRPSKYTDTEVKMNVASSHQGTTCVE